MSLPEPTTRSPGKLVLIYLVNGTQHLTGVRYLADVTLPTEAEALTDATALANALKGMIVNTTSIVGYRITDPAGSSIIEGSFAAAIVGTRPSAAPASKSATVTFTGKGSAVVSGERTGQTRMAIYTNTAYVFVEGQKTFSIVSDANLTAMRTHLAGATRYWADYYGQKASVRALATVQYNAHAQRKIGS